MDSARGLRARGFSILLFVGFCFLDVAFSQGPPPPPPSSVVLPPTPQAGAVDEPAPPPHASEPVPGPKESPPSSSGPPPPPAVSGIPPPAVSGIPPSAVSGIPPPSPPPPLTEEAGNTWNPSEKAGVVIASIAALLQVAVVAFLLIKRHQMLTTVDYDDIDDLESDDPRHNTNYRHADSA